MHEYYEIETLRMNKMSSDCCYVLGKLLWVFKGVKMDILTRNENFLKPTTRDPVDGPSMDRQWIHGKSMDQPLNLLRSEMTKVDFDEFIDRQDILHVHRFIWRLYFT